MRHTVGTKVGKVALASALGITGLGAGAVLGPAVATAATTDQSTADAVGSRVERIKSALSGLVSDGTLTQQQADRVASTLDENLPRGGGHGGFGHGGPGRGGFGLEAAATALGITQDELRTQLRDGQSIADIAQAEGVEVGKVVDALVKAAEERLAAAVEDGRITQAQADERKAELRERITERIDDSVEGRGGHGPRGGWDDRDDDGNDDGNEDGNDDRQATPAPSASATPS